LRSSLAQAKELRDFISIMLKGSICVVGAPSYLSAKFGTEWRLDVLFSVPTDGTFCNFLQSQIPSTRLIIHRQSNEMDSIPSSAIPMEIKCVTASSAALEKVFMELVVR
jgi:hypothetical protein